MPWNDVAPASTCWMAAETYHRVERLVPAWELKRAKTFGPIAPPAPIFAPRQSGRSRNCDSEAATHYDLFAQVLPNASHEPLRNMMKVKSKIARRAFKYNDDGVEHEASVQLDLTRGCDHSEQTSQRRRTGRCRKPTIGIAN
mmetsp:Transcript_89460/g.286669  ORF Transcript_89460/g.286669 Transcript_89460/m.286669 type:complete len:142 (-) Transcript_89460:296-721(-)